MMLALTHIPTCFHNIGQYITIGTPCNLARFSSRLPAFALVPGGQSVYAGKECPAPGCAVSFRAKLLNRLSTHDKHRRFTAPVLSFR